MSPIRSERKASTRLKFSELASGQGSNVAKVFSLGGAAIASLVLPCRQRRGASATNPLAANAGPPTAAAGAPGLIACRSEPDGDGRRCSGTFAKFEGGQDGSWPNRTKAWRIHEGNFASRGVTPRRT